MASKKMHRVSLLALFAFSAALSLAFAQPDHDVQAQMTRPWMNRNLSPDERADLVLKQMTLDEKIDLVHGQEHAGLGQADATRRTGQRRGRIRSSTG